MNRTDFVFAKWKSNFPKRYPPSISRERTKALIHLFAMFEAEYSYSEIEEALTLASFKLLILSQCVPMHWQDVRLKQWKIEVLADIEEAIRLFISYKNAQGVGSA